MLTRERALAYGSIALAVVLLDGAFKFAAHSLPPDTTSLSWPIALGLHKNYGIIGNIPLSLSIVIPVTLLICGVLIYLAWHNRHTAVHTSLACWIILCGAIGNLTDRIINNYTTDYLIFFRYSAVNLADGLILIGAVLIAWYSKESSPGATK